MGQDFAAPQRLLGEDAPVWLPPVFAAVGVLMAFASASAWLAQPASNAPGPRVETPRSIESGGEDRAAPQPDDKAATGELLRLPLSKIWGRPPPSAPAPAATQPAPAHNPTSIPAAASTPGPAGAVAPAGAAAIASPLTIDIPFARDSATPLTKGLEQALEHLRECLSDNRHASLLVEGHVDTIGNERSNTALGYSRAKAVRDRLLQMGISDQRIRVRSASANETTDQRAGAAINRRATVRIEGAPNCAGVWGETEPK